MLSPLTYQSVKETKASVASIEGVERPLPAFLRGSWVHFVAALLFGSAVLNVFAVLKATDAGHQVQCALSAAICLIAFVHYQQIFKIRTETGSRESFANSSVAEAYVDALRSSDWALTCPLLIVKLFLLVAPVEPWFEKWGAAGLSVIMVVLGAFTRLGCDDCAARSNKGSDCSLDTLSRLLGAASWICSAVIFAFLLANLYIHIDDNQEKRNILNAFFMTWVIFPAISLIAMFWRLVAGGDDPFPVPLSVIKDLFYGIGDAWTKGVFGIFSFCAAFGIVFP